MIFTLDDVNALRGRERNPVIVGELPHSVSVMLRLRVPVVHFSAESLHHVNKRHPDISDFDLLLIPLVIGRGLILREKRKPTVILAVYKEASSHRMYVAALKHANRACEVWLDSFYRINPREMGRLRRKADVLKEANT